MKEKLVNTEILSTSALLGDMVKSNLIDEQGMRISGLDSLNKRLNDIEKRLEELIKTTEK